jgi:hypothetical protein
MYSHKSLFGFDVLRLLVPLSIEVTSYRLTLSTISVRRADLCAVT